MSRYVPRHLAGQARHRARRQATTARLVAVVGLVLAVGATAGWVALQRDPPADDVAANGGGGGAGADDSADIPSVERPARPSGAGSPQLQLPAPSPPVPLVIPSIGVSSGLEALDMGDDGTLAAPGDYRSAGWFAAGTQPGQPGPSVIAGHVDSPDGPAVFTRLEELGVGDEVQVQRQDGSVVRFRVEDMETYPKDEFPTAAVYGPVPGAELRLVTCDGLFNRSTGHYVDNLVVYATVVDAPLLPVPS